MAIELKIPSAGESVTEAFIGRWLKKPGEQVTKDEPIAELETDKANFELLAPVSGTVLELLKKEGESAAIGEVVGYLAEGEVAIAAPAAPVAPAPVAPAPAPKPVVAPVPVAPPPAPAPAAPPLAAPAPAPAAAPPAPAEPAPPPGGVELKPRVMPAARRALEEHGLSVRDVQPTGPGGRLLKEDVLRHVEQSRTAGAPAAAPAPAPAGESAADVEVVRMTTMRRTIARRLVEAHQVAAILTTFNEVDMKAVYDIRARYRDSFEKRHGVRIGFMSFFLKAAIDALKEFPSVNAEIRGDDIVYHKRYHIGVAVSTERGLVVPVVRDADRLSFAELEKTIADLAKRGRDKKLGVDDLQGGTFTVTNGGLFGSLMSTPILNPPQTGVLGMHGVQDRPVVRDGQIVIRPMMYVALSYDHRLIDGREAVLFLRRIKEGIEDPTRMLIDV